MSVKNSHALSRTLGWVGIVGTLLLWAGAAWAGTSPDAPGGGGGGADGSSAPEPHTYALMLFSIAAGVVFVRRAKAHARAT